MVQFGLLLNIQQFKMDTFVCATLHVHAQDTILHSDVLVSHPLPWSWQWMSNPWFSMALNLVKLIDW